MSSSEDDVEVGGGFLVEGGGEVSVAPVGWRERRFVVAMWTITYHGIRILKREILFINSPINVMSLDEAARWGLGCRKGFKEGGSFRECTLILYVVYFNIYN